MTTKYPENMNEETLTNIKLSELQIHSLMNTAFGQFADVSREELIGVLVRVENLCQDMINDIDSIMMKEAFTAENFNKEVSEIKDELPLQDLIDKEVARNV